MRIRWLVYKAWYYWRREEPFPVDLYGELLRVGISPEKLTEAFDEGDKPGDLVFVYEQHVEPTCPFCYGDNDYCFCDFQ